MNSSSEAYAAVTLFDTDPFARLLRRLGFSSSASFPAVAVRSFCVGLLLWAPQVLLAAAGSVLWNDGAPREAFALDFAAHVQFLIGVPVLLLAEFLIGPELRTTARAFVDGGLVRESDDWPRFTVLMRETNEQAGAAWPVVGAAVLGLLLGAAWLWGESSNGVSTWHAPIGARGERLSAAGLWAAFVAVPILIFLIFRMTWKVCLWTRFLFRASRFRLQLCVAHSDRAGGLGCLGRIQAAFGSLVFGIGVVVAATIGYKMAVEGVSLNATFVWMPAAAFLVLAPLAFLLPMLFFSMQLLETKRQGLFNFARLERRFQVAFEGRWFTAEPPPLTELESDVSTLSDLAAGYQEAEAMRLLPFDAGSLIRLVFSAVTPFLPLLLNLLPADHPIRAFLSQLF